MTDPVARLRSGLARPWGWAWLLLCAAVLFWAGNSVVGRAAAGIVPPLALTFWRWFVALLLILPLAWPRLKEDWPRIRRAWKLIVFLGLAGVASFPSFLYWGLQYTTALNSVLLQAAIPPLVLLVSFLAFGERAKPGQLIGVGVSLLGVLVIITRGRLDQLAHLKLNRGDAAILIGICLYAFYPAMLRRVPAIHPLSLVACLMAVGATAVLPLFVGESLMGHPPRLTTQTVLTVGYVSIFASAGAYLFFNRGVVLIGSGRAGQYLHLMPVFGAVLAVVFLREALRPYHLAGVGLIGAGIGLSALARRPLAIAPGR